MAIELSTSDPVDTAELSRLSFASRLRQRDAALWGPEAESEASQRLGWIDLATESRQLADDIVSLRAEFVRQGKTRIVLCGMGGSSLAPEVICQSADLPLIVLDTSAPDQIHDALDQDLSSTVFVVSSKSGSTMETDSLLRAAEHALHKADLAPAEHIVVVTDPDSPLDQQSRAARYRVFHANPLVGGRYSALSAFGLVPSGLAGADITGLLTEAATAAEELFSDDPQNPALCLGAFLGHHAGIGVDTAILLDERKTGLGHWIEQLIAESTGKNGTGILPVVANRLDAPDAMQPSADAVVIALNGFQPQLPRAASVTAPLGAQFLLWEIATVVAGYFLHINPFDQPNVESAKRATRAILDDRMPTAHADVTTHDISAFTANLDSPAQTIESALHELFARVRGDNYLAVQAYLDRERFTDFREVREQLAQRLGRPVTFGWGPRFLHSTGQYHKGGPPKGVFLQISAEPVQDLAIPGRGFTFQQLIIAQAIADGQVLADQDRPIVRIHLQDAAAGLQQLQQLLI